MPLIPQIPGVNKGLFYSTGCNMTFLTTTTFSITVGQFRDSTNTNDINVTSAVTVNVRNNGANGLDVGTLAPNTFYAVYVIGTSTANDTSLLAATVQPVPAIQPPTTITASTGGFFQPGLGLISLSRTNPVLPLGFDMFRRVGFILTDATAAPNTLILKFDQTGNNSLRWMWYDAPIAVKAAGAAAAFTALSLAPAVPPIATTVMLEADLVPNAAGNFVALQPASSTNATGFYARLSGVVAAAHQIADMTVPCSIPVPAVPVPTINWVTDAASTVALAVTAYLDLL